MDTGRNQSLITQKQKQKPSLYNMKHNRQRGRNQLFITQKQRQKPSLYNTKLTWRQEPSLYNTKTDTD